MSKDDSRSLSHGVIRDVPGGHPGSDAAAAEMIRRAIEAAERDLSPLGVVAPSVPIGVTPLWEMVTFHIPSWELR